MSETVLQSRPVLAWMEILDRIDESLKQSLSLASEPSPGEVRSHAELAALQQLDERLARWQTRLDRADQNTEQLQAVVAAEEAALAEMGQRLGAVREKLSEWEKRAV